MKYQSSNKKPKEETSTYETFIEASEKAIIEHKEEVLMCEEFLRDPERSSERQKLYTEIARIHLRISQHEKRLEEYKNALEKKK